MPIPRLRPETNAAPIAVAAPADAITPEMTPEIPAVGKFVKKKFLWPGDGDTVTANDTPG